MRRADPEGDDRLSQWASARRGAFFLEPEPSVLPSLGAVSEWVLAAEYKPAAKDEFFRAADYQLVAAAHAAGCTVVSLEVPQGTKKRVKIPDVCVGMGVKQTQLWTMLSRDRAKFVRA
tara:strand:+ start:1418 stop:1771 length:354 start_codon:yes stop_codon:yes gene_type:complete